MSTLRTYQSWFNGDNALLGTHTQPYVESSVLWEAPINSGPSDTLSEELISIH